MKQDYQISKRHCDKEQTQDTQDTKTCIYRTGGSTNKAQNLGNFATWLNNTASD